MTDSAFLHPTLISVWSLIRHLKGAAELHFWGRDLTANDWAKVRRVLATNPAVTLHEFDACIQLRGAKGPKGYISGATMGRLFLPRQIQDYVLYIDGDTLITGDVSPLFALDLGDAYAGVVRDYTLLHWLCDKADAAQSRDRFAELRGFMGQTPLADYFNAGVLLLNCDAIRNDPETLRRVEDLVAACACSHGDQDHLNEIFGNNVVQLDLAWNASWSRCRRHRAFLRRRGLPEAAALRRAPTILHYHGPRKPWREKRWDFWSSRGRATIAYRMAMTRYLQHFPDLQPE